MRIPLSKEQKIKSAVHGVQAVVIFIAGCLTLAAMTKAGPAYGASTGFFFAMCFISIPVLIYQVMVPMWTRAWRFASIYAYACLDIAMIILWFCASVAVAAWNAQGVCASPPAPQSTSKRAILALLSRDGGASSGTTTTPVDSSAKCSLSKATVGFGLLICLLFGLSATFAVRAIADYRRTGVLANSHANLGGSSARPMRFEEDPSKDPWSTETDEVDTESNERDQYGHDTQPGGQYGLLPGDSLDNGYAGHHSDTAYHSSSATSSPGHQDEMSHNGSSYVPFPAGNYNPGRF